jgi:hypothetical protein
MLEYFINKNTMAVFENYAAPPTIMLLIGIWTSFTK